MMELVDETERTVAQLAALAIGKVRHRLAFDLDLARARRVEPAEDVQQRALAGAGRADDRERLAARTAKLTSLQHFGAQVAFLIGLGDLVGAQDDIVALMGRPSFLTCATHS